MLKLAIREATLEDLMLYFYWANDPLNRQNALNNAPIPLEKHQQWFIQKLNNPQSLLYLVYDSDSKIPLGQVRFDLTEDEAIIDYSLDKNYRGKGLGLKLLDLALKQFIQNKKPQNLSVFAAYVKIDNSPSIKIFERLKFQKTKNVFLKNQECISFKKTL